MHPRRYSFICLLFWLSSLPFLLSPSFSFSLWLLFVLTKSPNRINLIIKRNAIVAFFFFAFLDLLFGLFGISCLFSVNCNRWFLRLLYKKLMLDRTHSRQQFELNSITFKMWIEIQLRELHLFNSIRLTWDKMKIVHLNVLKMHRMCCK